MAYRLPTVAIMQVYNEIIYLERTQRSSHKADEDTYILEFILYIIIPWKSPSLEAASASASQDIFHLP